MEGGAGGHDDTSPDVGTPEAGGGADQEAAGTSGAGGTSGTSAGAGGTSGAGGISGMTCPSGMSGSGASAAGAGGVAGSGEGGAAGAPVEGRCLKRVLILGGQSNRLGPNADPARVGWMQPLIRYYNHGPMKSGGSLPAVDFGEFRALQPYDGVKGKHGTELALGEAMLAAGCDPAIIRLTQGNTSMFDWLPEDSEEFGELFQASLTKALGLLPTEFPDCDFAYYLGWNQGEAESGNLGQANLWAGRFGLFKGYTEHTILTVTGQTVDLPTVVYQTHIGVGDPVALDALRAAQASVADRVVNGDDLPVSGLHYPPSAIDTLGAREAEAFISLF